MLVEFRLKHGRFQIRSEGDLRLLAGVLKNKVADLLLKRIGYDIDYYGTDGYGRFTIASMTDVVSLSSSPRNSWVSGTVGFRAPALLSLAFPHFGGTAQLPF